MAEERQSLYNSGRHMRGIYSVLFSHSLSSLQSGSHWKFLRGARSRDPTDSWKCDSPLDCNGCQPVRFKFVKVSYSYVETILEKQKQTKKKEVLTFLWCSFVGCDDFIATLGCFKFGTSVKVKAPQMLLNLIVGGPLHGHSRFVVLHIWGCYRTGVPGLGTGMLSLPWGMAGSSIIVGAAIIVLLWFAYQILDVKVEKHSEVAFCWAMKTVLACLRQVS